jgi:hypothetical protein
MSKQDPLQESILQVPPSGRLISPEDALDYETGRTNFIESYIYKWFPKLFLRRFKKRYQRYTLFIHVKKMKHEEQVAFFNAVNRFYDNGGKLH